MDICPTADMVCDKVNEREVKAEDCQCTGMCKQNAHSNHRQNAAECTHFHKKQKATTFTGNLVKGTSKFCTQNADFNHKKQGADSFMGDVVKEHQEMCELNAAFDDIKPQNGATFVDGAVKGNSEVYIQNVSAAFDDSKNQNGAAFVGDAVKGHAEDHKQNVSFDDSKHRKGATIVDDAVKGHAEVYKQNAAIILWSFGCLREHPGPDLFNVMHAMVCDACANISPVHLAMILWAYAIFDAYNEGLTVMHLARKCMEKVLRNVHYHAEAEIHAFLQFLVLAKIEVPQ